MVDSKLLTQLETDITNGLVGDKRELLSRLHALSFPSSGINIPFYQEGDLPIRSQLESPLVEANSILQDLYLTYSETLTTASQSFNNQRSLVDDVQKSIDILQNEFFRLSLFGTDNDNAFLWASDNFKSTNKIDKNQTTAFIDTSVGIASLNVSSIENINSYIDSLSVDKSACIGVPGNNLVIADISGSSTPEVQLEPHVVLEGETDSHANFVAMFDNQPSSWLEFEYNYVPKKQKTLKQGVARVFNSGGTDTDIDAITGGKGWGWRKLFNWPGESGWDGGPGSTGYPIADFDTNKNAKLVFTLKLTQPKKVGTIQIVPHVLGATYPIVRSILVSQDGEKWLEVAKNTYLTFKLNENLDVGKVGLPEGNYAGIGFWPLETNEIQYIKFVLEADGSYIPPKGFGHKFYFKITQEQSIRNYVFFSSTDKWIAETRLANPAENVPTYNAGGTSLNGKTLGSLVGSGLGAAVGSLVGATGVGAVVGGAIGSLLGSIGSYSHTSNTIREGSGFDIFSGTRSAIGIKFIQLGTRDYVPQSQIVSKVFTFNVPLNVVSLITSEKIPNNWDNSTNWIAYLISTDGHTWRDIVPLNKSKGTNDTLQVHGATQIFVKIIMSRPSNALSESPSLFNYIIKGLPV